MPLYEYACEKCGEQFEVMQKFSDEQLTTHEKCGGRVHRLISVSALKFKGSGWYVNDYAKSGSSASSEKSSDNGAPAKSDSPAEKSSGKSDTPAAAPSSSPASSSESKPASSEKK